MMVEDPRWLSGRESEAGAYELVFLHEEPKVSHWSGFDTLDGRIGTVLDLSCMPRNGSGVPTGGTFGAREEARAVGGHV